VKYIHYMQEPTAVDQVLELVSLLQRDMAHSFAQEGMTEARSHVLWVLQDGPVTQRVLAETLRVTPRNITGLVDGLVATGHVVRRPHPTDRRATLVDLTDVGAALLASMVDGYAELHEVLFGGLSERQLATFRRTLGQIVQRLRARLEEEGI
jgi:DNA-binding MarR family transcriptional regulator